MLFYENLDCYLYSSSCPTSGSVQQLILPQTSSAVPAPASVAVPMVVYKVDDLVVLAAGAAPFPGFIALQCRDYSSICYTACCRYQGRDSSGIYIWISPAVIDPTSTAAPTLEFIALPCYDYCPSIGCTACF
jgi:hypothetical protein